MVMLLTMATVSSVNDVLLTCMCLLHGCLNCSCNTLLDAIR